MALFVSTASVALAYRIDNPYKNYRYWYKGSLHAHSQNSPDGTGTPASVGQWYKSNGHDFYTITDHDYVTPDPGVSGISWLGLSEEDTWDGSSGHIGQINIVSPILSGNDQNRINTTIAQGGFSIFNHALRNSASGFGSIHMSSTNGATGLEVYNGKGLDSSIKWDAALSYGKKLWGFSNDDAHKDADRGTAYNVVNSSHASPSKQETIKQIKAGNFYASRGLNLRIRVKGNKITAYTTNGSKIRWKKQFGEEIKTISAKTNSLVPKGGEKYIRVEVLDSSSTAKAWSQPLFITGEAREYIDRKLLSSADDGGYNAATNSYTNVGSTAAAGKDGSNQVGANFRFRNINIARGTKIEHAYLLLGHESALLTAPNLKIKGADENNSAQITSGADWISRSRTGAQVDWDWSIVDLLAYYDWMQSPDIKGIVQEIINRKGWKKGRNLQIFLEDDGSPSNAKRSVMLRNHSSYGAVGAPRLVIYTDNYKPATSAKKVRVRGKKARLSWKVSDPYSGKKAYVILRIKKRTYSKARANKRARYFALYKQSKRKYNKTRNRRLRRRYLALAKIYKRRYKRTKAYYYRHIKTANYKWTKINKTRTYVWRAKVRGTYRFYVYARDKAGNRQRNVASKMFNIK